MNDKEDENARYHPAHQHQYQHPSPLIPANLIELTITFPSPWYLINSGADPTSVPQDLLQIYVARAIADKKHREQVQAGWRDIRVMMMADPASTRHGDDYTDNTVDNNDGHDEDEEDNTPHTSAWWMAGDVLRLLADTLEREVRDNEMRVTDDASHQQRAEAFSCLYTSDRFRVTWRQLDSMPTNISVSAIPISTGELTSTNTPPNGAIAERVDRTSVAKSPIADRDGQIAALEDNLQACKGEIRERDDNIRKLEDVVAQRDERIATLDRRLHDRDEEKGRLDEALREVEELRAELHHVRARLKNHNNNSKDKANSEVPATDTAEKLATFQSQLTAKDTLIASQEAQIVALRTIIRRLEYEAKTVDVLRKECERRELGAAEMPEHRAKKEKFVEALVANDGLRRRNGGLNIDGEVTDSEVRFGAVG